MFETTKHRKRGGKAMDDLPFGFQDLLSWWDFPWDFPHRSCGKIPKGVKSHCGAGDRTSGNRQVALGH